MGWTPLGCQPIADVRATPAEGSRSLGRVGAGGLALAFVLAFFSLGPLRARGAAGGRNANRPPLFTDVSRKVGLDFVHDPGVEGEYFMPESLGSGGAFLDYDGDGDLDVYLVNGALRDPKRRAAKPLRNRLFRQESDGTFRDVTDVAGIGDEGYGMGVAVGDMDNDGDPDVYVTNFGPDALYRNNGDGTFTNVSNQAGIRNSAWSSSALFFDYDLDGDLDIYVANYLELDRRVPCADRAGKPDYCGPRAYRGVADVLYRNNGNGTFTDVSVASRIAGAPSKGLGVTTADFDSNGYPDVFVANDGVPNQLWLNQGDGTFRERALLRGLALDSFGSAGAGMGVALGDADEDGDLDLYVTQLFGENNDFFRNIGAMGFAEETAGARLMGPDLPLTGFGTGFFDFDNDGDLDLALANGRIMRGTLLTGGNAPGYWDHYAEPNLLFENVGHGAFTNVSAQSGAFGSLVENSRGLAFGDVDNDGGVDLLVTNGGGRARLLRNDVGGRGHWLLVSAIDPRWGRQALGARIDVTVGERTLHRIVAPAYSYLSSSDPRVHFGLSGARHVERIEVRWPDGGIESFPGCPGDRIVTLTRGRGR
jgi:hypothetical protein